MVDGDNHFIVQGPTPDTDIALALARHWRLIEIGSRTPLALQAWMIVTRAYRENLQWAVIVPSPTAISRAVAQLLDELEARGVIPITISRNSSGDVRALTGSPT